MGTHKMNELSELFDNTYMSGVYEVMIFLKHAVLRRQIQ